MTPSTLRLLAGALLTVVPLGAFAQTSQAYTPPQLAQPGASAKPAAGPGDVSIQVFVKKDGSFTVKDVFKTTNPADNEVALEIAKTAKYTPAMRDGKPVDAFYDYTIKFTTAGFVTQGPTGSGPTADAYALIRNGKYDEAKAKLNAYLQSHPDDAQAATLLGVADAFSGDNDAAAIAFDGVKTIPDQYRALAIQAYAKHASNMLAAQKYPEAYAASSRLIALSPESADGYFVRGLANANQQKYAEALPDLQKSLELAKAAKQDDKSIANVEYSIAIAQLNTGAFEAAAATAKDVVRLDPLQQSKLQQAEYVGVANDAIASANAGKIADAVAKFETGATLFPASAGTFYGQAAYVMLTEKTPDYKKLKLEAEKALAIDPTSGRALFVRAFVEAQAGDSKAAVATMTKAKASPLYASDASFAKQVDDNLKKLTAAAG